MLLIFGEIFHSEKLCSSWFLIHCSRNKTQNCLDSGVLIAHYPYSNESPSPRPRHWAKKRKLLNLSVLNNNRDYQKKKKMLQRLSIDCVVNKALDSFIKSVSTTLGVAFERYLRKSQSLHEFSRELEQQQQQHNIPIYIIKICDKWQERYIHFKALRLWHHRPMSSTAKHTTFVSRPSNRELLFPRFLFLKRKPNIIFSHVNIHNCNTITWSKIRETKMRVVQDADEWIWSVRSRGVPKCVCRFVMFIVIFSIHLVGITQARRWINHR